MEVTALRSLKTKLGRQLPKITDYVRLFRGGSNLHGLSSGFHKYTNKCTQLRAGQRISSWMGKDCCSSGLTNHGNRGGQIDPGHGYIGRLAIPKVLVERSLHAGDSTCLQQPLGEMGPADAIGLAARQGQHCLVGTGPLRLLQPGSNCTCPFASGVGLNGKPRYQPGMVNINAQSDDMHRKAFPKGRQLQSRQQPDTQFSCLDGRFRDARHRVMVRQGQYLHPGSMSTCHQIGRAKGAIRADTVGMQVNNRHGERVWV